MNRIVLTSALAIFALLGGACDFTRPCPVGYTFDHDRRVCVATHLDSGTDAGVDASAPVDAGTDAAASDVDAATDTDAGEGEDAGIDAST